MAPPRAESGFVESGVFVMRRAGKLFCLSLLGDRLSSEEINMPRKKATLTNRTTQSAALAEFAATALVAAEQRGVKKKPVEIFPLDHAERAITAKLPFLPTTLKKKLGKTTASFTIAETASIVMGLADALPKG